MPHILKTKLFIPHTRSELVRRQHLFARLDRSLHARLTLISAPAGFGKTTLVAHWLDHFSQAAMEAIEATSKADHLSLRPCWISLDTSDNITSQFAFYLISALQHTEPSLEMKLSALLEGQMPLSDRLITILINELANLEHQFMLVLDDYHLIDNADIHAAVTFLLEHLPPQLHLMIVTRADPPLPLAHLRAQGQLVELRADDLRFSLPETDIFLNQIRDLALASEDVATLEARTEGWIASLQLAAVAMQSARFKPEDRHQFVLTFAGTDRYVVDYLVSEVLEQQSDLEDFLLHTAILNRFCAELCDYVCQGLFHNANGESPVPSRKILAQLETANLFLIPLDHERRWYRYHHLFGDLLQYRLREQYPDRMAPLHNRASQWFEQNDLIEEAIEHALAAEAYERAATLIEQSAHTLFSSGKMPLIQQWITRLPAKLIRAKPQLYLIAGWLLFRTGQFDRFETHLQKPPTSDITTLSNVIQGEYLILQAHNAFIRGHFDNCQQMVAQAQKLLPPNNLMLRMPATTLLAWCAETTGELSTAIHHQEQAAEMGYQADSLTGIIASLSMLVQLYAHQRDQQEATATFSQVCQFADERGAQWIPLLGPAYIGIGQIYYQQGRVEDAVQNLQEGISRCKQWGGLNIRAMRGYAALIEMLQKENKIEEAQRLLGEAKHFAQTHNVPAWAMDFLKHQQPIATRLIDPLTQREREVLGLLVSGYSSPQIAKELVVGVSTVRTHVKRIYGKLDVHSRREAIARAHELRLV